MARGLTPFLRNYFITGVLVSLPLVVTLWVLWLAVQSIESALGPLIAWLIGLFVGEPVHIPGIGIILTFVVLILVGMVATNVVGRRLVAAGERVLLMFPVVRPIYTGVKQVIEAFGVKRSSFREVVLLPHPRPGLYAIGFVTNEARGPLVAHLNGEPAKIVFVPTVPNPTSGSFIVAPEKELIPLDLPTEEAFKMILSGGVLLPDELEANGVMAAERDPGKIGGH